MRREVVCIKDVVGAGELLVFPEEAERLIFRLYLKGNNTGGSMGDISVVVKGKDSIESKDFRC
ncbi:hypothetical protein D3C73_1656300 [compost metagenome]